MDDIGTFDDNLAYLLNEANRLVQDHYQRQLRKFNLTPLQVYTLCILKDKKLAMPSEIAAALKITRPSTTELLKRMQRDGLTARVKDTANRRRQWVVATTKGTELMERAQKALRRAEAAIAYEENIDLQALKHTLGTLTGEMKAAKRRTAKLSIGKAAE